MKGSEKQIAWAEDIKRKLVDDIDSNLIPELYEIKNLTDDDPTPGHYADSSQLLQINMRHGEITIWTAIDAIINCDNAKWFIDYGRNGARYAVRAAISGNSNMGGLI